MNRILVITFLVSSISGYAQDKTLPYYEIPADAERFTAGSTAARMIDGLGFRFYWATEGLRAEDLAHKPSTDARTCEETIEHIYSMSFLIVNATTKTVNVPGQDKKLPFSAMRKKTLENLKAASDILRKSSDKDMESYTFMYKQGDGVFERPFWNLINGPIADCIWHTGQIVSFRRSSGNPFPEKVDVFSGKAPN